MVARNSCYINDDQVIEKVMGRSRQKQCCLCHELGSVLFRVQYGQSQEWIFVCRNCWNTVSNDPDYRYGGTWKAKK